MLSPYIAFGVIFWITCSVLAHGLNFAYFSRKYKCLYEWGYKTIDSDWQYSFGSALLGPVGLFVIVVCLFFYFSSSDDGKTPARFKYGLRFTTKPE